MDKPLIAVTSSTNCVAEHGREPRKLILARDYVHAIAQAGGIPVIACEECPEQYAELCAGLLMTGGPDVSPHLYGEEPLNDTVKTDPDRDTYEEQLWNAFKKRKKPIFGICRGHQFINVMLGGSLIQDLDFESGWNHRDLETRHVLHVNKESVLGCLCGDKIMVNTIHHQAVKTLGNGLCETAHSLGGVLEAYEHKCDMIFGIQFHPEKLSGIYNDGTTMDYQILFDFFVDLAATCNKVGTSDGDNIYKRAKMFLGKKNKI